MSKRIQEMREESAAVSVAPSEEELSGSDSGSLPPDTRENSLAPEPLPYDALDTPAGDSPADMDSENGPSLTASGKKKGRPKGSKNHHKRSDAGIPKGPRVPKAPGTMGTGATGVSFDIPPSAEASLTPGSADATPSVSGAGGAANDSKRKVPRSEKRSKSMVEWWARRKAKEAEDKAREAEAQAAERQRAAEAHARYMSQHTGLIAAQQQQQPPPPPPPSQPQPQQFGGYTGPYPPTGVLPPPGPPQGMPQHVQQHWGPGFSLPGLQGPGGLMWHPGVHHPGPGLPPPMQPQPQPPQQAQGQGQQGADGHRRDQHGFVRSF